MYRTTNASFSGCGDYRYLLGRQWGGAHDGWVTFIMLNPSTADAREDDPTIRRCVGFGKTMGVGALAVVNLFAYRSTDPKALRSVIDPVGPDNDDMIVSACKGARHVICAWGTNGTLHGRDREVVALLESRGVLPKALDVSKDGHPKHPLYLSADLKPTPFIPKMAA